MRKLLFILGFVISFTINMNGQFTLDSLVANKTLRTVFEYNEKGLPIYVEEQGIFENYIDYDSQDRIEKIVTKKYGTEDILSTQKVVLNAEGKYDSLNFYDGNNFMHTSSIYKYNEEGFLYEVRSHHFYDDTLNTEDHALYFYEDGLVSNFQVKYGELIVGKVFYFYSEDKRLKKVKSSYSGTFELSYNNGKELSSFVLNNEENYQIYRNNQISNDMFRSPKVYYDHIYNNDGYGLGEIYLRDIFVGSQPTGIISDEDNILVKYYFSTTVDNDQAKIHGEWLNFFPNPTQDGLQFDRDISLRSLSIYDMRGQLVEELKGDLKNISIGHLPDAMYLVYAIDKQGNSYVSKIVKSK